MFLTLGKAIRLNYAHRINPKNIIPAKYYPYAERTYLKWRGIRY